MSGERDLDRALDRLLARMSPRRNPGVYLFCTGANWPASPPPRALAMFEESEGTTLVVEEADAKRHGLKGDFRAVWITLDVPSDLAAVGFLARISTALAAERIPCNAIAAYHHDHLFVPEDRAADALATLERLQSTAARAAPAD